MELSGCDRTINRTWSPYLEMHLLFLDDHPLDYELTFVYLKSNILRIQESQGQIL